MPKKGRVRIPDPYVLLRFDEPFDGLWVKARRNPVDPAVYREIAALLDDEDGEAAMKMMDIFARAYLVDWNADDKDGPVPPTPEGFSRIGLLGQLTITRKWMQELANGRE
jgi:hypothetical protein